MMTCTKCQTRYDTFKQDARCPHNWRPVPPELHTAKLNDARIEKRPFSIWRMGELIGTTYNYGREAQEW